MPRVVLALLVLVLPPLLQGCTGATLPDDEGPAALGTALTLGPAATAQRHTPEIDLGDLGGGSSLATDINNSDVVVGWSFLADGKQRAFRWTQAAGMTDLGVLPGHDYSRAIAVTDDGRIIGISGLGGSSEQATVVWDASGAISRLDIPLLPGASSGEPADFNRSGSAVGWDFGSVQRAWRWSGGSGKDDISSEAGAAGESGYASALNETGTVTGTTTLMCGEDLRCWRPFLWNGAESYSEIGLPSGTFGVGFGINNASTVVGWAAGSDNVQRPYRWRGAFEWLPSTRGAAFAVNSNDVSAGYGWDDVDQVTEAVAWAANGHLVELSPGTHTTHAALSVNDHDLAVGWVSTVSGTATRAMLWPVVNGRPRSNKALPHLRLPVRPRLLSGTATCVANDALVSRATLLSCLARATSR